MDNFNISRKIVECRQKKGINQEELANFIGVSKASVSKWERGHSFPEITFLPLLASYFDITIDELMGYEPQMSKENIRTLYLKCAKDFTELPFQDVFSYCETVIKKYYSCYPLLFQMANLYLNNSNLAGSKEKQLQVLSRAKDLFQRVRLECDELNLINQATLSEALCQLTLNEPQQAIALLKEITRELVSPAPLLSRAYEMVGANEKAMQSLQIEIYQFLINFLQLLLSYIPLLEGDRSDLKDMTEKYLDIARAFKIKELRPDMLANFYLLLGQEYMKIGMTRESLAYLKDYTHIVTGNIYPLELKGDEFFTKIEEWLQDFPIGRAAPRDSRVIRKSNYEALADNPLFSGLKDRDDYQSILNKLKDNYKNK
ncbi:transcriptional repressor DicA [Alloiococcus otitis]|uniref:HTH cro/C1-type domain-containing protein n=1 Tax=Alloiococcus otitis ATCC 51267 TaxID=883081 RepID=K9ECE7_9LACT|nr:helix-turn-helix transcriptional regulator [Alloiococcus otitis]EKU94338.1 hypothetical protein HMPREF9698_00066 [Alloiococcus otitis ATCC 51267]SUU81332.1 transcriptional repressor DicA [Alloiococcus otitis]